MNYQAIFKRFEIKYLLTRKEYETVLTAMAPYMVPDQYSRSTIRNIYFDTEHFTLVRRSIEKPIYKEKLRIRTYQQANPDTPVFVELKKKYDSVVYKRRLSLPEQDAMAWVTGTKSGPDCQIGREIDYFISYYKTLQPSLFLSYQRDAYCHKENRDLRITFDDQILCRCNDLCLNSEIFGTPILPRDTVLMEIKTGGGIPLWLTNVLTNEHIFKTSFSKYGNAYQQLIYPQCTIPY